MSDDVRFTIGGDVKSAEQALDRFDKKLEQSGQSAKKQGTDLEGVGQKSERAASSLMQVAGAISQIGKGNVDIQSLTVLTKEATGAIGDLGDTLAKAGGSGQALGGALHAVSGFLGPAGVLLAGATALYTVWKQFNTEAAETPGILEGVQKRILSLREDVSKIKQELLDASAPKASQEETGFMNETIKRASRGSGGLNSLIDALSNQVLREQGAGQNPLELARTLSQENRENTRRLVAEMLKEAQSGAAIPQERLKDLADAAIKWMEGSGAPDTKQIDVLSIFKNVREEAQRERQAADAAAAKKKEQELIDSKIKEASSWVSSNAINTRLSLAELGRAEVLKGDYEPEINRSYLDRRMAIVTPSVRIPKQTAIVQKNHVLPVADAKGQRCTIEPSRSGRTS